MTKNELLRTLELDDAFAGYVPDKSSILWGWNCEGPVFGELIREAQPRLIIEVGAWIGLSTATMAKELQRQGYAESCIITIDTWLGSGEHWLDKEIKESLGLEFGFPTLYPRFLSNMINAGVTDFMVPLPMTSVIAARYLKVKNISADLIYIDGSHNEQDVYDDCVAYWDLLAPGGIMFGDDWGWDSVVRAVKRFCNEHAVNCETNGVHWKLIKN